MITNIKIDKLEGPKILGKIDLPTNNDTRPKPIDERRKRKRIVVEKKQVSNVPPPNFHGRNRNRGRREDLTGMPRLLHAVKKKKLIKKRFRIK